MAANTGATIEQVAPYIDRLLEQCGMFKLPPDTNAGNILDRLNVIFSQIDGKSDDKVNLNGVGEVQLPAGAEDLIGSTALSARLRPVTAKDRERQEIAARIAKQRNIPYIQALELVP